MRFNPSARHAGAVLPALALALIAPVCAEYLVGYDDTIGDPAALIFGLFVFVPIYGAPAVLIRELTRRRRRGWPTIFLLATGFGVIQAGLLDQSLFNPHYRDISYWDHLRQPTLLPGSWTSAAMILGFIGGHVVGSISAPIALTEALFAARAGDRWLGPAGLAVAVWAWAVGAVVVLTDTLHSETSRPSGAMITTGVVIAAALVAAAFAVPATRRTRQTGGRAAPSVPVVFVVSLVALGVRPLLDSLEVSSRAAGSWLPTLGGLAVLIVFAWSLTRWSRRPGWNRGHHLAVAAGALLAIGAVAFTVRPIGHVPTGAKYLTNAVLLLLLITSIGIAAHRLRAHRWASS